MITVVASALVVVTPASWMGTRKSDLDKKRVLLQYQVLYNTTRTLNVPCELPHKYRNINTYLKDKTAKQQAVLVMIEQH